MDTAIKKKLSVNKKPIPKFFWFIGIGLVIAAGFFFFLRDNEEEIEEEGILLEETPMPVDAGVASFGFEDNVALASINAKPARSSYRKISGNASLYIIFENEKDATVKVKNYIDGIYEGGFYRLSFWAKAGNGKELIISIAGEDSVQELGKVNLAGDEEVRFYEFLFQAENGAEDLIVSSRDEAAADVWLDDVFIDRLEVNSVEEMKNLQPSVAGETFWKNVSASQVGDSENNSGDFFSRPNRRLGQIIQLDRETLSGIALKIQKKGSGGEGNYHIQIREVDENAGIPSSDIIASAVINCDLNPEMQEEIEEKEKIMREELARKEKAIAEKRIADNLAEAAEKIYPVDSIEEDAMRRNKEKRERFLEAQIREMKEGFNTTREVVIPIAAKLDPEKKYWVGISNKGVKVDSENYLKIFLAEEGNGKMLSSETNLSFWKDYPGNLWLKTLYPKFSSKDKTVLPSGMTIVDLGGGEGCLRYALRETDYNSFSGFSGRKIYDMNSGGCDSVNGGGNCMLASGYAEKDNFAAYKFKAFHPVKKIILRDIVYLKSLCLEISFDGKYWEEIASEETEDPKNPRGTISHLVINGNGKSDTFYLRVSPQGEEASLANLDVEALLSIKD